MRHRVRQQAARNANLTKTAVATDSAGSTLVFQSFSHRFRRSAAESVGKRFGRLTVLELLPMLVAHNGKRLRCLCDCGKETIVRAKDLPNGNTVSCGCRRVETEAYIRNKNASGSTIGFWTILERLPPQNGSGCCFFRVRCVCGVEKQISSFAIRSGHSNSCGCRGKSRLPDVLEGARYGALAVLSLLEKQGQLSGRSVLCKCDCGNRVSVPQSSLFSNNAKSCGCKMTRRSTPLAVPGEQYNHLTALKILPRVPPEDFRVLCRCQCGKEISPLSRRLIEGHPKSCGCMRFGTVSKARRGAALELQANAA